MRPVLNALVGHRHRLARFALTGLAAGGMQLLLLHLLEADGLSPLLANATAFMVATQANFALSQLFTWRDRSAGQRDLPGRWLRFHGAVAGSAVLNMAVFAAAALVMPSLAAAALGIAGSAALNFVSGERFVFRPLPASTPQPEPSPSRAFSRVA
jgi:putative flippase GtrA